MKIIKAKRVSIDRNGVEKVFWEKVGILFDSNGKIRIKLDMLPVSFDGWLYVFDDSQDEDPPF